MSRGQIALRLHLCSSHIGLLPYPPYEHALALLFWKQVRVPRSYSSSPLFHSEYTVWMRLESEARTRMSMPEYSMGSPTTSVLDNCQTHCIRSSEETTYEPGRPPPYLAWKRQRKVISRQLCMVCRMVKYRGMTGVPGTCAASCCWIRSVLFATDGTPLAEPYLKKKVMV